MYSVDQLQPLRTKQRTQKIFLVGIEMPIISAY